MSWQAVVIAALVDLKVQEAAADEQQRADVRAVCR
jgi:hypothetical protein